MTSAHTKAESAKWGVRLGGIVLVLIAFWIYSAVTRPTLLPAGTPAPEFNLPLAGRGGARLGLSDLNGKVVVLDFWSWGCPPCIEQSRELEFIHRNMRGRGVAVVGVSAWGETDDDVLAFMQKKGLSYHLVTGTRKMVESYQAHTLPTLYLIDASGRIALSHVGFMPRDQIEKVVLELLAQGE